MPPKKTDDKGKGPALEQNQNKTQTPSKLSPKAEPWITITKKKPQSPEKIPQTPESILDQMKQLQKAFEKSFSKQEEGSSSQKTPLHILNVLEAPPKQLFKNVASQAISKTQNNTQLILKEPSQNTPSEYFTKSIFQNIITVEKGFFIENDPFLTIERFFGKNQYYKPFSAEKTVLFYQTILDITGSVTFKHFFLDESHQNPAYSTFKIHEVISPNNWDYDLSCDINFPESTKNLDCYNTKFNYWDYQQAWYNSFLIQSPKHSHTWLIFFDTSCDLSKSPNWFNQWWNSFGSNTEIFKPQIQKSFQIFANTFQPTKEEKSLNPLALFHSKFHLPYVFSWTLDFTTDTTPVLIRKFKIKWWDKYKIPSNLYPSNMPNWIKAQNLARTKQIPAQIPTPQTLNQTPETTLFLAQKSRLLSLLASAKSEEEMEAISLSFLPNSRGSPKEAPSPDPDDEDLFDDVE